MKRLCLLVLFVGCNQSAPVAPSKPAVVPAALPAAKSEFAPQAAPAAEPQPEPLANFQVGGPCFCQAISGGPPTCVVTLTSARGLGWSDGAYTLQCANNCHWIYDDPSASVCAVRRIELEVRANSAGNPLFEVRVYPAGRPGVDRYYAYGAINAKYEYQVRSGSPANCPSDSGQLTCVVN